MITYSKVVIFFKLTFFSAALFILGILFIVSPPDRFGEPVKVSSLKLEKDIAYQILGAKLRGATESGHRFDFKVDSIDPHHKNSKDFYLNNLNGTLSIFEKDIYNISANKAFINSTERFIDLVGDLNIKTKSGISGKSQKIRIQWDSIDIILSSEVELITPLGTIYGGTMKISNTSLTDKKNPYVRIENGVKLLYQPKVKQKVN